MRIAEGVSFENNSQQDGEDEVIEAQIAQNKLDTKIESDKTNRDAKKAKLESPSYKKGEKDGWKNGYIIGKADARDGRARRGLWAKKQAELFMIDKTDEIYKEAFIKNMHEGYNEAWHAKRNYMKAQGLID